MSTFHAHASASSLLIGEHSVLHGHAAVVLPLTGSVKVRLEVEETLANDAQLSIHSDLADLSMPLTQLQITPPLTFALQTLHSFLHEYCGQSVTKYHLRLSIDSTVDVDKGFGSSAATTVAIAKALFQWQGIAVASQRQIHQLLRFCVEVVRKVQQGRGSGADLAAAITGKTCVYRQHQGIVEMLDLRFMRRLQWLLIYAGYKTPTAEVIAQVEERFKQRPEALAAIYTQMGVITQRFIGAVKQQTIASSLQALQAYQQYMVQLGVSDATLDNIVRTCRQQNAVAKISGSGLGDCVLAIADPQQRLLVPYQQFVLPIAY